MLENYDGNARGVEDISIKLKKLEDSCVKLEEAKIKHKRNLGICYDAMRIAQGGGRMERKMFDFSVTHAAKQIRKSIAEHASQADLMEDYLQTPKSSLKLNSYIYVAIKPFAERLFEK